jgi:hypothetical protein
VPLGRRLVIFDVENSSRVEYITRLLDHLGLATPDGRTKVLAVGNWTVVAQETARVLAHHGARLLHSAPAPRVKDWSDMRIAADAGLWLGTAQPGDQLQIITDDQAFDAVGDVAARHGVAFERLSYRALVTRAAIAPAPPKRRARRRPRARRSR